jgi:hypothetical protein
MYVGAIYRLSQPARQILQGENKMTEAEAYFIQDAMHAAGHECDVRDRYSGRRMYGKETYAIVVDDVTAIIQAVALSVFDGNDPPEAFQNLDGYREDSMGRQTVIY